MEGGCLCVIGLKVVWRLGSSCLPGMSTASPRGAAAVALLLLCTCARICHAEGNGYYFHVLSQSEGLSESTVTTVVQDNQGFVWLGTQNGLDRYDGYSV